ncbi:MAG: cell division protein ZapE, partial [Halomonas sp.]|nr:cell division protein ZapE [Halomonas sp.]
MSSLSARQDSEQASRLTPFARYQEDLKRDDFQYDPAQEQAVKHLQRLYDELLA